MMEQLEDDQWGNPVYRYTRNPFLGNRRQRNNAHRKILKGVRERGFLRPGEDPPVDLEAFKLDPKAMDWVTAGTQMLAMMQNFTDQTKKLEKRMKEGVDYDHLVNADTGQKIYMKELFFATMLWPIEEVLELVPVA